MRRLLGRYSFPTGGEWREVLSTLASFSAFCLLSTFFLQFACFLLPPFSLPSPLRTEQLFSAADFCRHPLANNRAPVVCQRWGWGMGDTLSQGPALLASHT